jgi:hypothetical protein
MLRICRVLVTCLAILPVFAVVAACGGNDPLGAPAAGRGGTGAAGESPSAAGNPAGSGAAGAGSGASAALHGYFNVTLNPALEESNSPPSTSFLGKLYDGPTPSAMAWTQKMEAGGCKLFTPNVFFCEPSCTGGAICTADDTCSPYPSARSR